MKRKRRIILPTLLLLLLLVLGIFFLPLKKAFTFTEYRTEHPAVFYVQVSDSPDFEIRYVHSIFLTEVVEKYRIHGSDSMRMISMRYEDVGIGLPAYAEEGESLVVKDGVYTLSFDDKVLDSFVLFVGDVDAGLHFKYRDIEYDLKKHLTRGDSYTFEIKRLSLYQMMKGVEMNG